MITDEMLRAAAGEVSAAMAASIPEQAHTFSPGFEGKMRSLIRRSEHPLRRRVLRQAAAVLIAVLMVFSALYLTVPSVRAAVHSWIRTTVGSYIQYSPGEATAPEVQYDYYLPDEFDGYTLIDIVDSGTETMHVYLSESGQFLFFDYYRNITNSSVFLMDIEDHQYISGCVGTIPAELYLAPTDYESSFIVWSHPTDGVMFCIQATADKDELIALAEKVEKIEKNKT